MRRTPTAAGIKLLELKSVETKDLSVDTKDMSVDTKDMSVDTKDMSVDTKDMSVAQFIQSTKRLNKAIIKIIIAMARHLSGHRQKSWMK